MLLQELHKKGLIDPPRFLLDNTHYLVRMGSEAYGASLGQGNSDIDVQGFAIPKKDEVFPHTAGYIFQFGAPPNPFQQWTNHHVNDGPKEYDLTVYSIVKFFHLVMENNPNMVDTLFVPDSCVLHSTKVGNMVRKNRKEFLHKGSMHKLRGFAFSQMSKIKNKRGSGNDKRQATITEHGYDTKHAYHVVRLCLQAEQILSEGDLELNRNSQMLLSVRRGEWTFEYLERWFEAKEIALETLYSTSTLRHNPDVDAIKSLLLRCLEQHYGSLDALIAKPSDNTRLLREMQALVDKYS
jgi:predicted nucleotidyltransferase